MEKRNILEVNNLKKSFKLLDAVKSISFNVKEGEIFGFLGQNGAGKSTTINMITTMLSITSGSIILDGFDIEMYPSKVREKIGIVFQQQTLDEKLTVERNLTTHAKLYNVSKEKIKERVNYVLNLVSLNDKRSFLVGTLSGGQKRRVELARSLIHQPKILFLDEPTTGLDPQTRADIWKYVLKLQKEQNMTIFLTTHYMDEAEVCDRIAIMDEGTIIQMGTPTSLKEKLTTNTIEFKSNQYKEISKDIKNKYKGVKVVSKNDELLISTGVDYSVTEIVKYLMTNKKYKIEDINIARPSMDDVFLTVINNNKLKKVIVKVDNSKNYKKTVEEKKEFKKIKAEKKVVSKKLKIQDKTRRNDIRKRIKEDINNQKSVVTSQEKKKLKLSIHTIISRDFIRFISNKAELITSLWGPLLLIVMFGVTGASNSGNSFSKSVAAIIPGTIATSIITAGVFQGISLINDVDKGIMKEMLVSPVRRSELAMGKVAGGTIKTMLRGTVVFLIGLAFPVEYGIQDIFISWVGMFISSIAIISGSMFIATKITDVNAYQSVISMLMMPLIFFNGAYASPDAFPIWLRWIILVNPNAYTSTIFNGLLTKNSKNLEFKDWGITITPEMAWGIFIAMAIVLLGIFIYSIQKMHGSKEYKRGT